MKVIDKRKKIIMLITTIMVITFAIVGATFAYFSATITGNNNASSIIASSAQLGLVYNDGNEVNVNGIIPGWTSNKTFSVTNNGNTSISYSIVWAELLNEIVNEDLVYSVTGTTVSLNETVIPTTAGAILNNINIDAGETHEYIMNLTFINRETEQNINQGKIFAGKIEITTDPVTEEKDLELVDNLSLMSNGLLLNSNPNRGFRGEASLIVGSNSTWPKEDLVGAAPPLESDDPFILVDEASKFDIYGQEVQVSVVKTVIYLYKFAETDLTLNDLNQLTDYFNHIKELGLKTNLIFAYKREIEMTTEPSLEQMLRNNEVLKTWVQENERLFRDVVYGVELGLIGLWGEVHNSSVFPYPPDAQTRINYNLVIESFLEVIPRDYTIMLRDYIYLYDSVEEQNKARLSFHDDYYIGLKADPNGYDWVWGMQLPWESDNFKHLTSITSRTISDGEMPWGWDQSTPTATIDLNRFTLLMATYGFSTFSLNHNYHEYTPIREDFIFNRAQEEYITEQYLIDNNMPYNPAMIENGQILVFDYINAHLGYQLGITNYKNNSKDISFVLNNFGFGPAINMNIKITDSSKVLFEGRLEDLNLEKKNYHTFNFNNVLSNELSIEIYNRLDNKRIKLANNLSYTNGINILPIN